MARFDKLAVMARINGAPVVPVFYHKDAAVARQVLKACHEGGIRAFEFTNRGDFAHEIFGDLVKFAASECPEMALGVGSVVDPATAALYIQLGACFVVGPLFNPEVARICNRRLVPYVPGCGTVSEVGFAQEAGCDLCKVFPGDVLGPKFVKGLLAPMPWSRLMVTGGVEPTAENLRGWFAAGVWCVGMGSKLFPKEVIAAADWQTITDYFQSLGLGFLEYFQLCEDLGAEPLPVLNAGLVCQYQNSVDRQIPLDSLQTFIDDAIDLIEFANGDVTTPWGAVRARAGHPEPFNMKLLAFGNEQWGPEYVERLRPAVEAIRKAHPEIKIIGSSGPDSEGDKFDYLWPEMKNIGVDLVDEHFYRDENWFLSHGNRYDGYDRKGPRVFAGAYACHTRGMKRNNYRAAIYEAAFMTGLERNADVVHMATYAPLLAHKNGWQWRPDLIWFDNRTVVPSVSYYVQQLYAANRGSRVIPLTLDGKPAAGNPGQSGLFASAVYDDDSRCYIIKAVNTADEDVTLTIRPRLKKKTALSGDVETVTLASDSPEADNTFENPTRIVPAASTLTLGADGNLTDTLPALTFRLYRLPLAR